MPDTKTAEDQKTLQHRTGQAVGDGLKRRLPGKTAGAGQRRISLNDKRKGGRAHRKKTVHHDEVLSFEETRSNVTPVGAADRRGDVGIVAEAMDGEDLIDPPSGWCAFEMDDQIDCLSDQAFGNGGHDLG